MTAEPLPELDAECFFIAPIGAEGSETRDRSDGVMEYIVAPAAAAVGLTTIRADKIAKPGLITRQIIEHVVGAKAAVVDLTDANPNVYYEMGVRHTAQLPTVLIAQDGEKLPFDIAQMRTIFFDHTSLKSAAECRDQITQHLQEALEGEVDSPIAASVTVQRLEHGSPQDRVLAQIVDGMDELRKDLGSLRRRQTRSDLSPAVLSDLDTGLRELVVWHHEVASEDARLDDVIKGLARPIQYLTRRPYRGVRRDLDEEIQEDLARHRELRREAAREAAEAEREENSVANEE